MKTSDEFEMWWPTVGQTIGKVAAQAAWDARQQEIDALKAEIERLKSSDDDPPIGTKLYTRPAPVQKNAELIDDLARLAYGYAVDLDGETRDADDDELEAIARRITSKLKIDISVLLSRYNALPSSPNQSEHKLDMVPSSNQDVIDAKRYRWLRDPCSGAEHVIYYSRGDYGKGLFSESALDEAIDTAMQRTAVGDA